MVDLDANTGIYHDHALGLRIEMKVNDPGGGMGQT